MSAQPYTPREGSVAWKTIQFFTANPEEQLDADLISAKFDCARANVHTLLGTAVHAGLLRRKEDLTSGELVYGPGAGSAAVKPSAAPVPDESVPRRPLPEIKKPRSAPFSVDLDKVQIEKGVPLPGRGSRPMDWAPLLERLEAGDSFSLPAAARSSIGVAITRFHGTTKKRLSVRTVEGGIRVWRIE